MAAKLRPREMLPRPASAQLAELLKPAAVSFSDGMDSSRNVLGIEVPTLP